MELARYVAERIRELRTTYGGGGISQEELARAMKMAANTISRWETGTYRPSIEDLDLLSRFFGVSILEFFPKQKVPENEKVQALLRTASELPQEDIDELQKYAEFRKARALIKTRAKKAGRPRSGNGDS